MTTGWIADVLPNTPVESEWGNRIRDGIISTIPTVSDFAGITQPTVGQHVFVTQTPGTLYMFDGAQWVKVAEWYDSGAGLFFRWTSGAWGRLNGSAASVTDPATDPVLEMSATNVGSPIVLNNAGFGPFQVKTPGSRIVQISGVIRFDGGQLTSGTGNYECHVRRVGAAQDLGQFIASVDGPTAGPGFDTSRVMPLFAVDLPPSGTVTYEIAVVFRSGVGTLRVMTPCAAVALDVGASALTSIPAAAALESENGSWSGL